MICASEQGCCLNEHAFDVIDNEDAAYWLGSIAADGNVSIGRRHIGLSTKDTNHVRKFAF
jgi:hypothetical protein